MPKVSSCATAYAVATRFQKDKGDIKHAVVYVNYVKLGAICNTLQNHRITRLFR